MSQRPQDPTPSAVETTVRGIPLYRKIGYVLAIWGIVFLVAELGARVGGYLIYGRSPFFLFYGIKSFMADSDPNGHSVALDGYFKFPPSRTLQQYGLFTDPTPIRINALGFRGPDFGAEKSDSVTRVMCLGESSTFGFFNSDTGTYPAQLGGLLADASTGRGRRYEVINAGIPHANSDNIRAMVEHEIFTYQPDVLTLYAGFNDAGTLMSPSRLHRSLTWMHGHFASYVAFKQLVSFVGGPELPSRWSVQAAGSDSADVAEQIRLQTARYRRNVEWIADAAAARGVRLLLIRQALTTGWGDATGLSYREKVDRARSVLQSGGRIPSSEATLFVHAALMNVLDSIAAERDLAIVDFISIVDQHPEYFASYVHLTETANLALARELAKAIESEAVSRVAADTSPRPEMAER